MPMKHIHWFAYHGPELPSVRYRATGPLRHLRDHHGITSHLVYPGWTPLRIVRFLRAWCSALFNLRGDALIVVQKVSSDRIYARLLKLLVRFRPQRCWYDIDDAEWFEKPAGNIRWFMDRCAGCFVGSSALAGTVQRMGRRAVLLPSPVPEHHQVRSFRSEEFTVGWVGCYGGDHRTALIEQVFPAIERSVMPARLVMLGVNGESDRVELQERFADCHHVRLELPTVRDWQDEEEVHRIIAGFDVGIASMLDSELHRYKSTIKIKQYWSCGVPVAASPVGENNRALIDGWNGFTCRSAEDFRSAFARIACMSGEEYAVMSGHALETARRFNLEGWCRALLDGLAVGNAADDVGDRVMAGMRVNP